jgi:hypothetical protein
MVVMGRRDVEREMERETEDQDHWHLQNVPAVPASWPAAKVCACAPISLQPAAFDFLKGRSIDQGAILSEVYDILLYRYQPWHTSSCTIHGLADLVDASMFGSLRCSFVKRKRQGRPEDMYAEIAGRCD